MGLSIAELELESTECLPPREVMSLLGWPQGGSHQVNDYQATTQTANGLVAVNVDAHEAGIGNGNNVNINDVVDVNENQVLSDILTYKG